MGNLNGRVNQDNAPPAARRWPRRAALALLALGGAFGGLLLLAARPRPQDVPRAVRPATFAGDAACLGCHADRAAFETTAHRLTTRLPTRAAFVGSFAPGENVLRTTNAALHFRMDAGPHGDFYQTAVSGTGADTTSRTERIAWVAGSGRKGQSFLYWHGNRLFQLPVSYYVGLRRWIYSPGEMIYVDGEARFDRAISRRCLECHATFAEWIPDLTAVNRFDSSSAILGVTCERCHAGGREHVRRERSPLRPVLRHVQPTAIANPAHLSRERQMDACAQCHAGGGQLERQAFTYVVGERLADYVRLQAPAADMPLDVHGNQVALLERSRCYQASQMTCITCHDVHRPQRDANAFSARCTTCHEPARTAALHPRESSIAGRCVSCHMPAQTSTRVVSSLEGQGERIQVRNHWIRVYSPEELVGANQEAAPIIRTPAPAPSP